VGISLGVCAIAAVLGIWFFRRRRLEQKADANTGIGVKDRRRRRRGQKPELSTGKNEVQEMDSSTGLELDPSGHPAYEVGSNTYRHEAR
jgi:hypothetical protein